MLDVRVQTFLTVCRTLNYTRAAEELNVTQPAVSQHIAHLERYYGTKLFSMRGKRPTLTEAGKVLYRALSTMAHDESLLREHMAATACQQAAALNLGMTLTAGEYIVAPALAAWVKQHPDVRVTVQSGDTHALLGLLEEGRIDGAFVEGIFDKHMFRCDTLCTERLVCLCAPQHPMAGTTQRIEDLLGEHLIVREPGSGTRAVFEHALGSRNLSISSFARTSVVGSIGIIKTLVAQGIGITFLYEAAVQRERESGRLGTIALTGSPIGHDIAFARLDGSVFEKTLAQFFGEISLLMKRGGAMSHT